MRKNNALAARIKELREAQGLSQAKFAELARLSPGAIATIETSVRFPKEGTLKKIASALGVSVDALLGEAAQKNKSDQKLELLQLIISSELSNDQIRAIKLIISADPSMLDAWLAVLEHQSQNI